MATTNDSGSTSGTSKARSEVAQSRQETEGTVQGVMATAQDAAERVRSVAGTVADQMPAAVASAQSAASDTARQLEQMPNQSLMLGAAFSLGLGAGLFLTGANRLLVLLSLAPAGAMAATLASRESEPKQITARSSAGSRS